MVYDRHLLLVESSQCLCIIQSCWRIRFQLWWCTRSFFWRPQLSCLQKLWTQDVPRISKSPYTLLWKCSWSTRIGKLRLKPLRSSKSLGWRPFRFWEIFCLVMFYQTIPSHIWNPNTERSPSCWHKRQNENKNCYFRHQLSSGSPSNKKHKAGF